MGRYYQYLDICKITFKKYWLHYKIKYKIIYIINKNLKNNIFKFRFHLQFDFFFAILSFYSKYYMLLVLNYSFVPINSIEIYNT